VATWTVIYERGPTSWGAYVPALPGLGVVGNTTDEVEVLIREGIVFHLEGLAEEGLPVPVPDPSTIEVDAIAVEDVA
jgi:predicted RNase H-like HicB family nuclease